MDWKNCRNLLVVRPDNMGDLLMSTPAIKALRRFTGAKITLLTSSRAAEAAKLNPDIAEVIVFDLPWVKTDNLHGAKALIEIVAWIKLQSFDGCVLFTVYSQNPLPAAMMAYLAEIPLRLAYCRENPYGLLTHWLPDAEPYRLILHQVERDLRLVGYIGADINPGPLVISIPAAAHVTAKERLLGIGFDIDQQYLILHAGVSEPRREFPVDRWIDCGRKLIEKTGMRLLVTGSVEERESGQYLAREIGTGAYSAAGLLDLGELCVSIERAQTMISVNTGTVHLAAAVQTPVVVLYAQTNPQHTPWMVPNVVLEYHVPESMKSKNEVVLYVDRKYYRQPKSLPGDMVILRAVQSLLEGRHRLPSEK